MCDHPVPTPICCFFLSPSLPDNHCLITAIAKRGHSCYTWRTAIGRVCTSTWRVVKVPFRHSNADKRSPYANRRLCTLSWVVDANPDLSEAREQNTCRKCNYAFGFKLRSRIDLVEHATICITDHTGNSFIVVSDDAASSSSAWSQCLQFTQHQRTTVD